MPFIDTVKTIAIGGCLPLVYSVNLHADLKDLQGQFGSELEERAAIANQQTYNQLKAQGCRDTDRIATTTCSAADFTVWENVRELVHTANELLNSGPTQFSLDSNLEDLGFSLRWTAGEEFSTQESLTDSFVSGQLSSLSSRITALRRGASGFNIAGIPTYDDSTLSGINAGDSQGDKWSRLGGFLNGTYTYGEQTASAREDAFDFYGAEINGGLDYRVDDQWVVGVALGYIFEEVDFDSSQSIVDGAVEMYGLSAIPFALYQSEKWYYSLSAGYQFSRFETERAINYPSFNANVDSINTVAISKNNANTFIANANIGYSVPLTPTLTFEPSLAINYQHVSIEKYSERDLKNEGFNFIVEQQNIRSLETVVQLKLRHTLNTSLGVFFPFMEFQSFAEHEDDTRFINASYGSVINKLDNAARFSLPTDVADKNYRIFSAGVSTVVYGARQKTLGAAASGGLQLYLNYRKILDVNNYTQKILSGGLRYEF